MRLRLLTLLVAGGVAWVIAQPLSLAQESSKIVVATFLFMKETVKPVDAILAYGSSKPPKTPPKEARDFWISLVDAEGKELDTYGIRNPRKQYIDEGKAFTSETIIEGEVDAEYTVRLPFNPKAIAIRVRKDTKIMATANLGDPIQAFCVKHHNDKDCKFVSKQSP